MPPLLIFDFDGVVADSELLANTLLAQYLTSLGKPTTLDDSIRQFMGRRAEDTAIAAATWVGRPLPETFTEDYRNYSRPRMRTEVGPVKGIGAFLDAHGHHRRCVASSSNLTWLDHCVDTFGFRHHFGTNLFSGTEVKHGKPAPDIFLHAAAKMEAQPSSAIVIEDSPAGIRGAKAAGMHAIGFLGGSHIRDGHRDRLLDAGADAIAETFADLTVQIRTRS